MLFIYENSEVKKNGKLHNIKIETSVYMKK